MFGRILNWLVSSVALVHEGQFRRLAGNSLNLLSQLLNLSTLLLIGWRD